MKSLLKLDKNSLLDLAIRLYQLMHSTNNKGEALQAISKILKTDLGEYLSPEILSNPDELSVSFIEMLDQIIFEVEENIPSDEAIRDYIIDDLYLRLGKYLDILHDRDTYKRNLCNSHITHEDTVIIKHYRMEEYIPELMTEFYEQPALKKSILRSLLSFSSEELINFYYQVIKGKNCIEAKVLSLAGLKMHGSKFSNWKQMKSGEEKFDALVSYVKDFNTGKIGKNTLPVDIYSLLFAIAYIEHNITKFHEPMSINWAVEVLKSVGTMRIDNSYLSDIYLSISNILIYCNSASVRELLKKEEHLVSFINLLDMLPPEFFRRITMKLATMGNGFRDTAERLISENKVTLKEGESNIKSYLLWESESTIL